MRVFRVFIAGSFSRSVRFPLQCLQQTEERNPYSPASSWLAGGGIKRGVVHGATDELGFPAVENRHYVTDIHATVLHQLGLDSRRLEVPGRKRLDIDHGRPIREIIA